MRSTTPIRRGVSRGGSLTIAMGIAMVISTAWAVSLSAAPARSARPAHAKPDDTTITKKPAAHASTKPATAHSRVTHSTSSAHRRVVSTRRRTRREPMQMAPTPERIQEIQSALAREGYYKEEPSGKWDADTVNAFQHFQQDHALTPSGKLDALSLQKLGLGSEIAGVSAPQPAMPATNGSTQSQNQSP